MRKLLIFLLIAFAISVKAQTKPNRVVSIKSVNTFYNSFKYNENKEVISFDYKAIYDEIGEDETEVFLNALGFSFYKSSKFIEVERDSYPSGNTCKPMKWKVCVLKPIQIEKSI